MSKIVFLGNGIHAYEILNFLKRDEEIVALFLHPKDNVGYSRSFCGDMRDLLPESKIIDNDPNLPENSQYLQNIQPDFIINVGCGYILQERILEFAKFKIIIYLFFLSLKIINEYIAIKTNIVIIRLIVVKKGSFIILEQGIM